jgi:hypothetical protein
MALRANDKMQPNVLRREQALEGGMPPTRRTRRRRCRTCRIDGGGDHRQIHIRVHYSHCIQSTIKRTAKRLNLKLAPVESLLTSDMIGPIQQLSRVGDLSRSLRKFG